VLYFVVVVEGIAATAVDEAWKKKQWKMMIMLRLKLRHQPWTVQYCRVCSTVVGIFLLMVMFLMLLVHQRERGKTIH